MSSKLKIILIGETGYNHRDADVHIASYNWSNLAAIDNICDYDVLIIDLLSSHQSVDFKVFFEKVSLEKITRILNHDGKVIVVGDPRFKCKYNFEDEEIEVPFLQWTGIRFVWDNSPGDTVFFKDDYDHRQYKDYIGALVRWDYSLSSCSLEADQIDSVWNVEFMQKNKWHLAVDLDKFCYNRYQNSLAFTARTTIFEDKKNEKVFGFGPIIFLPEIGKSKEDTLQIIFRDLCGIEPKVTEPVWITPLIAPGQPDADKKVETITTEIKNLETDLDEAINEREQIRACLKLLYEREYALEPTARSILRQLGAHVEDPTEPNKEDGWATVSVNNETYEAVLEIKSTKSDSFTEDGRKQLMEWIDRGIRLRGKKYKGIFIGNSSVDKPLNERPWPFSDSWQKSSTLSEICAIRTEDLYTIYTLKCQQNLDVDKFWKTLFTTNGIFDVKPFVKAAGEAKLPEGQ
jgi:hypothetical protein